MAAPPPTLVFKVHRREPELLRPAKPTPHEFKDLSDIDDQEGLRTMYVRGIVFYRYSPLMQGKDPVKIVREALAKTLVFYYPLAGRLREGPNRKLSVECTGEGVLFIEADADVTLEQFGVAPQFPYPCIDELVFDVPGSTGIVNCPLYLVQVTRLKCGGYILACRYNHAMCDILGNHQFWLAVSEIARGEEVPSILPVWERHLLSASDPPKVTHQHLEYIDSTAPNAADHHTSNKEEEEELVDRSFVFGPKELSALRSLAPPGRHSIYEILAACLWKCRTIALQLHPDEEVRVMSVVNARFRPEYNPPLPVGYYGNGFVLPVALTTAGNLIQNPIGFALDLVKKAKNQFSSEYVKSVASLMVLKDRPHFVTGTKTFLVSDIKYFDHFDFGWGKAVAGGSADAGYGEFPGCSYLMSFTDENGEKGIVFSLSLPPPAMERFAGELQLMLHPTTTAHLESKLVKSSL
ncbi:hypothetical protein Tsubulata_007234, partial [Turnera subulata]